MVASIFKLPPLHLDSPPIREWAENNIVVAISDRPGKILLDPYQIKPLEAMVNPQVEQVTTMWSSQLGKTLMDAVLLGYVIDVAPQPTMMVHASLQGLGKFIREKLNPLLRANPRINSKVERNNRDGVPNTGFSFEGGYVTMATPRSVSGKHGTSATLVIADEIDDYGSSFQTSSLKQRGITFEHACNIFSSTPDLYDHSPIQGEYETGSQEWFYVPCVHCQHQQLILLENIRGEQVCCVNCGVLWREEERIMSIYAGEWVAQATSPFNKSFWMSQYYSINVPLSRTLRKTANYTPKELSTQVKAWPYLEVVVPPLEPSRIRRCEREWQPLLRTAGVDVQGDRLEYYIVDFDSTLTRKHILRMGVIPRSPDNLAHWLHLRREVAPYNPTRLTVDGSFEFDYVLAGLKTSYPDAWLEFDLPVEIVRGRSGDSFDKPLRGVKHTDYFFGSTDEAKVLINQDLTTGKMTLNPDLPLYVEQQLCSEKLIRQEQPGGKLRRLWQLEKNQRNEALDCIGYAYMGAIGAYTSGSGAPSPELTLHT